MATLELNGKDFATQTSSDEPVIASTVTGAPALALTNATGTMPTGTQDNITRLGTVTAGNLSNTAIVYPAGHVLQVLSTSKVDIFTTQDQDFIDITGFTIDITPSATSSKIFIMASCQFGQNSGSGYPSFRMMRNSTVINGGTAVGTRVSGILTMNVYNADTGSGQMMNTHFLDSPSTTSATTYKIQGKASGAAVLIVGGGGNNPNGDAYTRSASTITVMEVAG